MSARRKMRGYKRGRKDRCALNVKPEEQKCLNPPVLHAFLLSGVSGRTGWKRRREPGGGCKPEPGTTKQSRAWGFTHRPPHLRRPLIPVCSQPGRSLHPPAPLPCTQTAAENRGPPRRKRSGGSAGLPPGSKPKRSGCAPKGCTESVGRSDRDGAGSFFRPPVLLR